MNMLAPRRHQQCTASICREAVHYQEVPSGGFHHGLLPKRLPEHHLTVLYNLIKSVSGNIQCIQTQTMPNYCSNTFTIIIIILNLKKTLGSIDPEG